MQKVYTLRKLSGQSLAAPNWLSDLNPQQQAAVTHSSGPAVIIAGAGTGKTKTLVYRVAWLLDRGVPVQSILLLTFTRKAAEHMLSRVSEFHPAGQQVTGGTFHSFANTLLREFGHHLGYGANFTILDSADSQDRIDLLRNQLLKNLPKVRFPKKGTLLDIFSSHRNTGRPVEQILDQDYPQFYSLLVPVEKLFTAYQEHKKKYSLADYDDLLFLCRDLIRDFPAVRETLHRRYSHILVDEYQDTNPVQAEIVERISGPDGNLMVVGDDAQSIYKFRGADFKNFLQFPDRFPGAAEYRLEENYRSVQPILDVANSVMSQASEKFEKNLFTKKPDGKLPVLITASGENDQNAFIISRILDLREEGVPLNQMAVLFRSARNSYSLELELNANQIPFEKRGGLKFTESSHIRDLIAYLRLLLNQKDIVSWNRVLQMVEGIGPRSADEIIARIEQDGVEAGLSGLVSPKYRQNLEGLRTNLLNWMYGKELKAITEELISFYRPVFERRYFEDYPKREKDLEAFHSLAAKFSSVEAFLSHLALDPVDFSQEDTLPTHQDERPLILSTIHSAKGLEWHTVFIMDLLDGILPSTFSLDEPEELDEELRLFYVAVTRAAENLYLVYPGVSFHRQFNQYFTRPSRFITGLPDRLLEKWLLDASPDQPLLT